MAIFFVLPPRPALGECVARMLRSYVPGVAISQDRCAEWVDSVVTGAPDQKESYIVHREDLPDDADLDESLRSGFGAEAGDQVVLVSMGSKPDAPQVRTWRLAAA